MLIKQSYNIHIFQNLEFCMNAQYILYVYLEIPCNSLNRPFKFEINKKNAEVN